MVVIFVYKTAILVSISYVEDSFPLTSKIVALNEFRDFFNVVRSDFTISRLTFCALSLSCIFLSSFNIESKLFCNPCTLDFIEVNSFEFSNPEIQQN